MNTNTVKLIRAKIVGLLVTTIFLTAPTAQSAAESIAVAIVVHPSTKADNLSMSQLRKIFLAEKQFWDDGTRITLLVKAPGAVERELVLDRIYGMNEAQFRKYWIAKMFRAEVPSGPKLVFSSNMALELVTAIESSITFLNANEVNESIKVVRIDGRLPTEEGYPLRRD